MRSAEIAKKRDEYRSGVGAPPIVDAPHEGFDPRRPGERMFADNVLVCLDWLRDQRQDVTSAGGIFIPAQARKPETVEATWGTVVAAGPGHHDEYGVWQPMDVAIKPGARVLVDMAQAGDSCMLDDVEHRIIRQKNIPLVQED